MKSHCAHLQGRSRVAGCSACVDLLGAVDNIKGVAFDVRVPCACCEGGRESKVQLRCLQKGPTLEFSVRFTLPQAQQCCKLPGNYVQPLRLPLRRAKKCASKRHPPVLRQFCQSHGKLFLALVPKPCKQQAA